MKELTTIKSAVPFAVLLSGICCSGLFIPETTRGGTINIDCQGPTDATQVGAGIIGNGPVWNPIVPNDSIASLMNDQGTVLPNTGAATSGSFTSGITGSNNPIVEDSIAAPFSSITSMSVFGLRDGKYYCVVVYNGSDDPGVQEVHLIDNDGKKFIKTLQPSPGPFLPDMIEGRDYVKFESVKGGGIGIQIKRSSGVCALAGVQISGWLEGEPLPHKTDLQVSTKKSRAFTGNNKYTGNQKKTVRGKRTGKFYFRLQNDGNVCGTYGARSKGSDRKANRKYFDVTKGRKNITAQIKKGKYRTGVAPGSHATIQAKVKPKGGTRKVTTVFIGVACDNKSPAFGDKNKAVLVK